MKLKLIAIGGLGNMLGPSAIHLKNHDAAQYIRVLDRGAVSPQKDELRQNWIEHGAQLVSTMTDLIGEGDFDGIVICAGKNGEDFQIFCELIPLLISQKTQRRYFILHLSTVSCRFVQTTYEYCKNHGFQYANYPLTGGTKGAKAASMLILCSGDEDLFSSVETMLNAIGKPKYFGERVDLGAAVKLIGHIMVFHGLLGISLAIALQKKIFELPSLSKEQADFFDFLNQGAGGTQQWNFAVRPGIVENNWAQGFLLKHAVIDIMYTAQLMQEQQLPTTLILPLLEVSLLFSYILNNYQEQGLTTQAATHLIANTEKSILDNFLKNHLSLDFSVCFKNCILALPEKIRNTLLLDVSY